MEVFNLVIKNDLTILILTQKVGIQMILLLTALLTFIVSSFRC